jgi:hypothetical protein
VTTVKLGAIASITKGWPIGQSLFVVMSSRGRNASALACGIAKDPMERLARRYRNGQEVGTFKTACIRAAYVSGEGEVTLVTPETQRANAKRVADEPDDTDQSNPDDGMDYDKHDFDNDPDWR